MAKCSKTPVKPVKPQYKYTLELNQLEAELVCALLGEVGGTGVGRDAIDNVYDTLYAEVYPNNDGFDQDFFVVSGNGIQVKD